MRVNWINNKTVNPERISELLSRSIAVNHFTNFGPMSYRLERRLEDILDLMGKKVVVTSSGTAALHALVSLFCSLHGWHLKFAVPAFTFPCNIQGPLRNAIVVDIDDNLGPDLDKINPSKVDGIIITNPFGFIVDIGKYESWAHEHKKLLLLDNAATPLTNYGGKNSLCYGDGAIISFHHTKPIGFGEGGAIIIDEKYEQRAREIINFGFKDGILDQWGSNWKMSDISAAYIYAHLDNIDELIDHHFGLYDHFSLLSTTIPTLFDNKPFISCFPILCEHPVEVNSTKSHWWDKIEFKKYYRPLCDMPIAEHVYQRILCCPCHSDMTEGDVARIIAAVSSLTQHLPGHDSQ